MTGRGPIFAYALVDLGMVDGRKWANVFIA